VSCLEGEVASGLVTLERCGQRIELEREELPREPTTGVDLPQPVDLLLEERRLVEEHRGGEVVDELLEVIEGLVPRIVTSAVRSVTIARGGR
jgi:hypothetical protein